MKRVLYLCLLFLGFSSIALAAKKQKDHKKFRMEFTIEGADDSLLYLANYYGSKQYYYDTAFAIEKGKYAFETDSIKGGIYLVVLSDRSQYFEIVVDGKETLIDLSTSKKNMVDDMEVSASEENKLFYTFQKEMNRKGKKAQPIHEEINQLKADTVKKHDKEIKELEEKLAEINDEVLTYKKTFINEHKGTFTSKIFLTSQEPEIPENPELPKDVDVNAWKFEQYKAQYLKNVDFSDERLLRSPVFGKKLEYYLTKLVVQIPDSINKEADKLVKRTKGNKEMIKYVVHWTTNHYERSKQMGMDAVFVHMADEYYCNGKAHWVDSAGTAKICERATALKPLLIGKVASNIILPDTTGKWHNLHERKSEFTVLYFWSPTCGHCKKTTPKLEKFYQEYKDQGVDVFGVCTELEMKNMKTFIKSKKLSFVNVSDTPEINKNAYDYLDKTTVNSLNFRTIYDIYSTPQVYILDKDKKIIAKKLGVEQIAGFLKDYKKQMNKKN